ncbi:MAG: diguanylate cyclase [Rhodocyclaceae bacterium]|nr:diguanylate cyclase [Rhodocyclaceae bacterium]
MPAFTTPPQIARETIRRLATARVAPTPDNYRTFYQQVAGIKEDDCFPTQSLKRIAAALPRSTPAQLRFARHFEQAISLQKWAPISKAILDLSATSETQAIAWAPLLEQMLEQLERHHAELTTARKKDALKHVLQASSADAKTLHSRLLGLINTWTAAPNSHSAAPAETSVAASSDAVPAAGAVMAETLLAPELGADLNTLMQRGVSALLEDNPKLATAVQAFGTRLDDAPARASLSALLADVSELTLKLEWAGEDQAGIRRALVALLQLIMQNISQLVLDDQWLTGQLTVLQQAFAQPLDIRTLDEVERRLRDVIDQQGRLKQELSNAQQRLKHMLAGFVDRLADMSRSTGSYHDTLEACAERIESAVDINQLSDVVEEMLRETRVVQEDARRSKDDLDALQQQVELANTEIAKLQTELHNTSELVRHDPLTGILNRKGLDEALKREIARASRRDSSLCVALLDIDNFKRINDAHGHHTGDAALRHLTEVVKDNLRPQDSVGRYGGEEFLILLPDTDAEHAVEALRRLQRALTSRYFLAEGQKMLITFSAGVARIEEDEAPEMAVDRADKAMYRAKRAGKNRVMMA